MTDPVSTTPQTDLYGEPYLALARQKFNTQTLWLLLSIHHYGWRAHLDVAHRLVSGVDELPTDDFELHHWQHRMMVGMESMFLLVDQLWRVALGARAHLSGGPDDFLKVYCRRGQPQEAFGELTTLTEADWAALLAAPTAEQLEEWADRHSIDDDSRELLRSLRTELPSECVRLVANVKQKFFDRWAQNEEAYAFREANNAHRHGTRLLYGDTAPEPTGWITKGPVDDGEHGAGTIDVLIRPPGSDGMAFMLKVPYTIETAKMLLRSMQRLSELVSQIVDALLLSQPYGEPAPTALVAPEWKPLR